MDRHPILFLSCILAGFALIKVPLTGIFSPLSSLAFLLGVITILLFSCVLIFHGITVLLGKRR